MTMTATVHLAAAGADRALAEALTRAIPRSAGRGRVAVHSSGDPARTDWFLLLASPEAAADPVVAEVLRARLEAVGTERMQVVVTAGTWEWDAAAGGLSASSTAAPEALRRAFAAEPRHMVFHGERGHEPSLRDPLFADQVAEILAPIIGTTKDDLAGEDVRRQRRTRTLFRAGIAALVLLLAGALTGGIVAVRGTAAAEAARAEAQQQRDDADSRRLAALAEQTASEDGALSRLLAVEAWRVSPTEQAGVALARAAQVADGWTEVAGSSEVRRLLGHATRPVAMDISVNSIATVDTAGIVRIWPVAQAADPVVVNTQQGLADVAWSHDGNTLGAAGGRVHLFAENGMATGFTGPRAPVSVIGPWGESGFVAGGQSVVLVADGQLLTERAGSELGLSEDVIFVRGDHSGERIVAASRSGEVVVLDADLEPVASWRLRVAADQFGERDSERLLAWDERETVIMPPDNATILGPIMGPGGEPDPQDNAIAGAYDLLTGQALEPLVSAGYLPLPATSATFLPDGSALAITSGGLESGPSLAATAAAPNLPEIPLPERADLLRVSPDGVWLAVAGTSPEVHLVQISGGESEPASEEAEAPEAQACRAAGRNLTPAEWNIYLPDRQYRAICEEYGVE